MKRYNSLLLSLLVFMLVGCASTKDVTVPYGISDFNRTEVVETLNGKVQGIVLNEKNIELFAGIPFAKPPVGDLRWREPEDVENWEGVLQADHFAPEAMQKQSSRLWNGLIHIYTRSAASVTEYAPMSEDCLYLNIWRPADCPKDAKLPVLVYVHGGSLTSGSSWFESYDGGTLASKGLVVVNIAYRVNIFGYFANEELEAESPNGSTGNYGLLDQIKALEWVNKNIAAFGGDVENITIAGESAGSSSVNALCASPLTKGMFRRAIAESSSLVIPTPPHTFRSKEDALKMGHKIMDEFGVSSIEELRKIPAEKLLTTKHTNNAMTVDGYSMPDYPWDIYQAGLNHEEALLHGFNMEEGKAFVIMNNINLGNYRKYLDNSPYVSDLDGLCAYGNPKSSRAAKKFYSDCFSAICFTYPHESWKNVVQNQNRPVWEYCFTKENPCLGTMHSGEMMYAYGNIPRDNKNYNEADYKLESIMTEYWANFAKYGDPNGNPESPEYGKYLPMWEKTVDCGGKVMELGESTQMITDPFTPLYNYFDFNIDHQKRPPTWGSDE